MATKNPSRLTRAERAFLDRALLAGEVVIGLKGRRLSPEGLAHMVADYACALLTERKRIHSKGVRS